MNYKSDFATVDLIISTELESRGVDAFALSLIKAEKQIRRVFTHLVFQCSTYNASHYKELRNVLADNSGMYFNSFINGLNLILPRKLKEVYGENYDEHLAAIADFAKDRNKIFHGQITNKSLSREDLLIRVDHIKAWCKTLGEKLTSEIGYDGFSDSFVKSKMKLELRNTDKFDTLEKYRTFLKEELQRRRI